MACPASQPERPGVEGTARNLLVDMRQMHRLRRGVALPRLVVSAPALILVGYIGLGVAALKLVGANRVGAGPTFSELSATAGGGLPAGSGSATLIYVFNPRDCPQTLRLARLWSAMHEAAELRVKGVIVDPPNELAFLRTVLEREGVRFPVETQPDRRLEAAIAGLGYRSTPITVLTDRDHRPRLILPGAVDSLAQMEQVRLVRAQLKQLEMEARLDERNAGR